MFFGADGTPLVYGSGTRRLKRPGTKSLREALKCADEAFLDFLGRCFEWEPEKRMTPEEALSHGWITGSYRKGSASIRLSLAQMQSRFPTLYRTHRKLEEDKLNKTSFINAKAMAKEEGTPKEMPGNKSSSNPNNGQLLYFLFNKMRTKEQSNKNKHQFKKSAII